MTKPQNPISQNPPPQQSPQRPQDDPSRPSSDMQGEGNYDATRRFDKAERKFVESGKVDEAARAAQPRSPQEADELRRAEREGESHSKGEDGDGKASNSGSQR